MVFAMRLFVSLALFFPTINCKITGGIRHAAGICGNFSDNFHPVLDYDCDFSSLVEVQQEYHIGWEMVQQQKLRDLIEMDEEASSTAITTIRPRCTTWPADIGTKSALVNVESSSHRAEMAVSRNMVQIGSFLGTTPNIKKNKLANSSYKLVEKVAIKYFAWEMSVRGFNTKTGPTIALTFQDFFGNSTPASLSVCDLFSNQRVLVNICTLSSHEASSLIAGMEDFTMKVPKPCGEPVLPKAKLETASSVMYMLRHTSGKVSCSNALSSPLSWQKAFEEHIKFHKDDIYIVSTLDLTFLAAYSSNKVQKLRGLIEMDEANSSLSTTSSSLQYWTLSDEIRCKGALVRSRRNYRRQEWSAGKAALRVGVPVRSSITEFVSINKDGNRRTRIKGFSSDVFEAAFRRLLAYKLSNLSYDEVVEKHCSARYSARYSATVGDYYRTVDFSRPYFQSGVTMVVKAKPNELNKFWWLLSPFTPEMWLIVLALTLFRGLVIWIIERENEDGLNLVEALLFFVHRESPRNSLTYLVLVPWLLLMLVVTSTYTAIFTSTITNSETEPSCFNVRNLKIINATIGCDRNSTILIQYLVDAIGFERKNIQNIAQSSIDEYAKALSRGNIKAAFLITPHANAFLAEYSKGFRAWEPIPNLQDSAFVFPRGSPFAVELSKLKQMQGVRLSFPDCSSSTFDGTIIQGIGPAAFSSLFILSGGASAIALLITAIRLMKRRWESCILRMLTDRGIWVWLTTLFSQNQWRNELHVQLSRIGSTSQTQLSCS